MSKKYTLDLKNLPQASGEAAKAIRLLDIHDFLPSKAITSIRYAFGIANLDSTIGDLTEITEAELVLKSKENMRGWHIGPKALQVARNLLKHYNLSFKPS